MNSKVVGFLAVGLFAGSAQAAVISGTYSVSAGVGGPYNPATVSFSISFDNSAGIANNTTTGITLIASNFTLGSSLGFGYLTDFDRVIVGGIENSSSGVFYNTNDFMLQIRNVSTGSPLVSYFGYSQVGSAQVFSGSGGSVALTFTPVSSVLEPGSLALLGLGLVGLGVPRRREAQVAGALPS